MKQDAPQRVDGTADLSRHAFYEERKCRNEGFIRGELNSFRCRTYREEPVHALPLLSCCRPIHFCVYLFPGSGCTPTPGSSARGSLNMGTIWELKGCDNDS